jgi:hypothetical protein
VFVAAGFLLSYWPLCLMGLLVAAASGQYLAAVLIGLVLDVLYGAPVGQWHFLHVPFTLIAFVLCAAHYFLSAYFRTGDSGRL